jgi:tetratricopeptide (TPR) repeat protein
LVTPEATPENVQITCQEGNAATCVLLAEQWLASNPDDFKVLRSYGEMLYKMTRYDEAIQVYTQAIERFPEVRRFYYFQMGHLHRYRGALADAELWYQKAINEDSKDAIGYVFLGAVQARQGKLREAEVTHRRAIQCDCPEEFLDEAYHNLGLVLRGQGRYVEAKLCFAKAIELCSDYSDAIEALNDVTIALQIQSNGTIT